MRRLVVLLVALAACSSTGGAAAPVSTVLIDVASELDETREVLEIPMSLYVVSEADTDGGGFGTRRTVADVEEIAANMAPIWAQAGITFEPLQVISIEIPSDVAAEIAITGRTESFFEQAGQTFDIPNAGVINGFYLADAAGVNGFTPSGSRVFFVVDEPSVNDERVSSHEVGHILGLHHDRTDQRRLMFSGTNGEVLTDEEQTVARYSAQGLIDGVR